MFYVYPGNYFGFWSLSFWVLNTWMGWCYFWNSLEIIIFFNSFSIFNTDGYLWNETINCLSLRVMTFLITRAPSPISISQHEHPHDALLGEHPLLSEPVEGRSPLCVSTLSGIFRSDSRFAPSNCPVSKSVALVPPCFHCSMSLVVTARCLMCTDSVFVLEGSQLFS